MKKVFLSLMMVLIASSLCFSQDELVEKSNNFPLSVGPFFVLKAGVNTNHPQGIENAVAFNGIPDMGATFYVPLTVKNKLGFTFDLAYTTIAYGRKYYGGSDTWTNKFNYIALSPNLHLFGFLLGFNFGIPVGCSIENNEPNLPINLKSLTSDDMSMLIEARIGAQIPVYENEFGRLSLVISGGYVLSGLIKDLDDFNPQPGSLGLGFCYFFNISSPE
jgi:hypothetical protein